MEVGVFAGYKLRPGFLWEGEYLVWALSDFASLNLVDISCALPPRLRSPHVVHRVTLYANKVFFPMKKEYDRVHATLEGARYILRVGGDPEHPHDVLAVLQDEHRDNVEPGTMNDMWRTKSRWKCTGDVDEVEVREVREGPDQVLALP